MIKYGSRVRGNRKGEQEINTFTLIILLSASGFDRIWEIISGEKGVRMALQFLFVQKEKGTQEAGVLAAMYFEFHFADM